MWEILGQNIFNLKISLFLLPIGITPNIGYSRNLHCVESGYSYYSLINVRFYSNQLGWLYQAIKLSDRKQKNVLSTGEKFSLTVNGDVK